MREDFENALSEMDERGRSILLYSVTGVSVVVVALSLIGLMKGNWTPGVVPLLAGGPVASGLVIQGHRLDRLVLSIAGMAVLLAAIGLAALLW